MDLILRANNFVEYINSFPNLSKEEEYKLIYEYKTNDCQNSKQKIILHNLRIPLNYAKHFLYNFNENTKFTLKDLIHEGIIGLLLALDKFNLKKETRFATYAIFYVKLKIQQFVTDNISQISFRYSKKFRKFLSDKNEKNPMFENALSHYRGLVEYKDEYKIQNDNFISLVREDDENNLKYAIETVLTEKEKYVIYSYFFNENNPTMVDIAKELNVSKQRVFTLYKNALKKLKKSIS